MTPHHPRARLRRLAAVAALALGLLAALAGTATAAPRHTAVIMLHFAEAPENQTGAAYDRQAVKDLVFGLAPAHPNSAREYWLTQTYGLVDLQGVIDPSGDIYGSYPVTTPRAGGQCSPGEWANTAALQAEADGFDFTKYDTVLYFFQSLRCSWQGLAGTGRNAYINALDGHVVNHEIGHTFGSGHSNTRRCYDASSAPVTLSDNCVLGGEYSDPFDPMGGGVTISGFDIYSHEMSPTRKVLIGAIPASDVPLVNTPGLHLIRPLETSSGLRGIRLPSGRADGRVIDVSVRRPFGRYDGSWLDDPVIGPYALNGVTLHLDTVDVASTVNTWLLDATPETGDGTIDPYTHLPSDGFSDAPLAAGKAFVDAHTGLTLTVYSVSDLGALVGVEYGLGEVDVAAPSVPGTPAATVDGHTVTLSWTGSTDLVGVTHYVVSRNGVPLPQVAGLTTSHTPAGGVSTYTVQAGDAAGNLSAPSAPVSVEFPPDPQPPVAPPPPPVTPPVSPPPAVTPPASPPPAVAPPPTVAPRPVVRRCKVPNLARRTLAQARTALTRAGCRAGRVVRANHPRIARGRVVSQGTRVNRLLPRGTAVRIVLSSGPRRPR